MQPAVIALPATVAAAPANAVVAPAVVAPAADLAVWAADADLVTLVESAAVRIHAATGLVVESSDDPTALPVFWTDRGSEGDWIGLHCGRADGSGYIAIDESIAGPGPKKFAVVLHELLHALGAQHVDEGAGIMSPTVDVNSMALTAADLETVCTVRDDCTAFVPE